MSQNLFDCLLNTMSMKKSMPVYIREPDPESKSIEDRLHWAVLRGKIVAVNKLLDSGKTDLRIQFFF